MIQIIISTVSLMVILYLIARHEAEISFPILLMISVGTSVITMITGIFIGPLALGVMFFLTAWAVKQFCYLSWPKAFAASALNLVVLIAYAVGMAALKGNGKI